MDLVFSKASLIFVVLEIKNVLETSQDLATAADNRVPLLWDNCTLCEGILL